MPKLKVALDFDMEPADEKGLMCECIKQALAKAWPKLITDIAFLDRPLRGGPVVIHPTPYTHLLTGYARSQEVLARDPYAKWCLLVVNLLVDSVSLNTKEKETHGGGLMGLFVKRDGLIMEFFTHRVWSDGTKEFNAPLPLNDQLKKELQAAILETPGGPPSVEERRAYEKIRNAFNAGMDAFNNHPMKEPIPA